MTADFWSSHIDDLLPAYHNGTLGAEDRLRVDTHLKRCAACQSASADWSAIANSIGVRSGISNLPAHLPNWMSNLESGKERDIVQPAIPVSGAAKPRMPGIGSRFATTAPVVLLVIVLVIAIAANKALQGSDNPAPTIPAMAAFGSATAEGTPTIACSLEPSSPDRLSASGATSYPDVLQADQRSSEEGYSVLQKLLPTGEPAGDLETAAVQSSLDQLVACLNAGEPERAISAFTDDYFRRLRNQNFLPLLENVSGFAPGYGSNVDHKAIPYNVESVVILPDGRLGALLSGPIPDGMNYGPPSGIYAVFVQQGDRWVIDEIAPIRLSNNFFNTLPQHEATLSVTDEGFNPATLHIPAGQTVISLTNNGSNPHSVVIRIYGIRVEVAPGETKPFRVVWSPERAFPGGDAITFFSDIPGDSAAGFTGNIIVDTGPDATPIADAPFINTNTVSLLPTVSTTIAFGLPRIPTNPFDPSVVPILADRDVAVTLDNSYRESPSRFVITQLGIDVEVGPGEKTTITINAPAGVYGFYSPSEDDVRIAAFGTLVVLADDQPMNGGADNS